MPLSFANPALLFGALGAALPVIIHFLSRRRVRRRRFSDLRFLAEVQSNQSRNLGIRRWLLLLLRVLIILCLAMAVAGPHWGGLSGSGEQSLLFVIDTSASMNTQMVQGTRLAAAIADCQDMIADLAPATSVQVLAAGSHPTRVFADWLPAGTVPVQSLAAIEPSDGPFDLAAALREANRVAARSPSATVVMVLLSDLQKIRQVPELAEAVTRLGESRRIQVLVRQVGEAMPGGGVLKVEIPQRALRPGENITVKAWVLSEHADQVFALEVDGQPVAEDVAGKAAGSIQEVSFALTVPGAGLHTGSVRKDSDAFPGDDTRPFVFAVPSAVGVLLVHGPDRPADGMGGRGGWRYLAEALAPGAGNSLFSVRTTARSGLNTGALDSTRVAILVDPEPLGRRALEALTGWVDRGGSLLVMAGDPTLQAHLGQTLLPALGLPGNPTFQNLTDGPGRRSTIVSGDHPVFAGLDLSALTTFEEITWRRWFNLAEGDARVLLELVGGAPMLIEGALGEGMVCCLPFNLRAGSTDLASSPMALPFFQRLVSWLARSGLDDGVGNLSVGAEAAIAPRSGVEDAALEDMAGLQVRHSAATVQEAAGITWQGSRPLLQGGILAQAGFATFTADQETLGIVAAAVPSLESTLALFAPGEWRGWLRGQGLAVEGDLSTTAAEDFLQALVGMDLAPTLLVIALLLLMLEIHVGRGLNATSRPVLETSPG